jgi:hypothetical protein
MKYELYCQFIIMSHVTCCVCDQRIELIPDGQLRFCPCLCLGVDCTKEYTRYIGTIPQEDPRYPSFLEKKQDVLIKLRLNWRNRQYTGNQTIKQ